MLSVVKNFSPGKKNYLGQNYGKKSRFRELSTDEIQKNAVNALPAATKSHKLWF